MYTTYGVRRSKQGCEEFVRQSVAPASQLAILLSADYLVFTVAAHACATLYS